MFIRQQKVTFGVSENWGLSIHSQILNANPYQVIPNFDYKWIRIAQTKGIYLNHTQNCGQLKLISRLYVYICSFYAKNILKRIT